MKLYELSKVISSEQDEITIVFPNDDNVKSTYRGLENIPLTYAHYEVAEVYGYDANGYDGIMISIVEE